MGKIKEEGCSRCMGHCCENFSLPFSPMSIENLKRRIQKGVKHVLYDSGRYAGRYYVKENQLSMIFDMVIFKQESHQPCQKTRGDSLLGEKSRHRYHYTCKHYDRVNRVCTVYEDRPPMCRSYGEGSCNYPGCTKKSEIVPKIEKAEEIHDKP